MRRTLADLLHGTLLALAIGLAAWLSVHWPMRVDLSHGARASLSSAARDALAALDGPLELVSYAREGGALRETIAAALARYRELKPDLSLRFVDPDADPGAMRERGITVDGELELRWNGREERVTELGERALVRAFQRLARPGERRIAFVAGHGERRADGEANHDYRDFAASLAETGVRTEALDLAQAGAVPEGIDLLVLADPRVAPGERELAALSAWLDRGGAMLWLSEPATPADVEPIARSLGVRALPGQIVDAAAQALGIGDPSFVAIASYPDHPATRGFELTTLFPQAVALAALGGSSWSVAPLARSGERSWTETGAVAGAIAFDRDSEEIPGPHDVVLALTRLSPRPDRAAQRVAVAGDADFLANSYLGNGGNRAFGLRLVNWLLADDALIDVAPVEAPDRDLGLDARGAALLGLVFLVLLPLALLGTGVLVSWARQRR